MSVKSRKTKTAFYCSQCGAEHPKWQGQCRECATWNSLIEERVPQRNVPSRSGSATQPVALNEIRIEAGDGYQSGISEFDRVLGGQLLSGMTVLLAGEPGIGKSTLLLQAGDAYARAGLDVLYVTGEESLPQVKRRAERLSVSGDRLQVINDTDLDNILAILTSKPYAVVLIDSVQTISSPQFDSPPGTVAQVREAANVLINHAKANGTAVFLVGHVTKEGLVAGPKVLEHMVDTVITFEGDSSHLYRILRATKNRFGSVLEIGLFEMTSGGLTEVENPSSLFLGDLSAPGTVVAGICEGNRPLMVEVQALVTSASYGTPQRVAGGIDGKKLALLLAILEKRCDYPMATHDVFVSVAGGLRVSEPALDLPILAAIVSSLTNRPADKETVVVGEVGLSGEVRSITNIEQRAAEAAKLGFKHLVLPQSNVAQLSSDNLELIGAREIQAAIDAALR
jgi:DNA repair protein RadA/Sms